MSKVFFYFFLCLFFTSPLSHAQSRFGDPLNNKGSGINSISLDKAKITQLTKLGMLWGFIKYYHPAIANGQYKMDDELFDILPKILATKDSADANTIMEKWLDHFGKPVKCTACVETKATAKTKSIPDYGYLLNKSYFSPSIIAKLEYIKQNRNHIVSHYYIQPDTVNGNMAFINELPYFNPTYPDAGLRLLSLYRYWNIIQYFYPNKQLITEDWKKTLSNFIPEFINAKDSLEYTFACLKLIATIHDTHADLVGGRLLNELKGMYLIPVKADFIEDKLIVVSPFTDSANGNNLQAGDIIERINDAPVTDLVKKYLPITSGTNYETQLHEMIGRNGFLFRSNSKEVELYIMRSGKPVNVRITLTALKTRPKRVPDEANSNAYRIINGNIGYIYPEKLKATDIDDIKKVLANTAGIVIDMRCHTPPFMADAYSQWLKPKASVFMKFTRVDLDIPGRFDIARSIYNGTTNSDYYKGKVVVIVNGITQGPSEFTVMALASAPGATIIGSPTAGMDGNVSALILPGGIRTMFTAIGMLYPDGTSTAQGVKIDKVVRPTIKGITEGKDELLDEAIKIISK